MSVRRQAGGLQTAAKLFQFLPVRLLAQDLVHQQGKLVVGVVVDEGVAVLPALDEVEETAQTLVPQLVLQVRQRQFGELPAQRAQLRHPFREGAARKETGSLQSLVDGLVRR